MFDFSKDDVDLQFAISAHNGISWSPEKRGQQYVDCYVEEMTETANELSGWVTDENRNDIEKAFQDYRRGYLKRLNTMLSAKSRCISSFITGPSGFPVARAKKANDREHNATGDWLHYSDWKREKLRRKFDPRRLANAPIRLDDEDAIEKLEKKIARLTRHQETMKAANKVVRNKKLSRDEMIDELVNGVHLTEETAYEILKPNYLGNIGFEPYQLSNNNANIRRLKDRLVQITREQNREKPDEYNTPDGVEVIENTDETRIQIIFPGKPEYNVRSILKKNGFRWAPSQGAWQRLLNSNGRRAAKYALSQITEVK